MSGLCLQPFLGSQNSEFITLLSLNGIGILNQLKTKCIQVDLKHILLNLFQKSFDELFSRAPAKLRSACKLELWQVSGLRLDCKNINETEDFLLQDDSVPDPNPNAIVSDNRASQQAAMAELANRVTEIVIRDSRFECVNIFRDFQRFKNLRRLTVTRSNVQTLNDCKKSEIVSDSENVGRTISSFKTYLDSLQSLETLDVSGNLLTRFEFNNVSTFCKTKFASKDHLYVIKFVNIRQISISNGTQN